MKDSRTRPEAIERWFQELWPRTLQGNIQVLDFFANCARVRVRLDGARLTVILEVEDHIAFDVDANEVRAAKLGVDRSLWAHLSVGGQNCKPPRVPSWEHLGWCKRYFLGDRKAIQVLPPRSEYVNENEFVLHLFVPLELDPLPDFRHRRADGKVAL
jgi:hypothetical protein